MPPPPRQPRVLGPSSTIDGAVDVESVTGEVLPVPRAMLPRLGLREGDAAVQQMAEASAPQPIAQAPSPAQPDVATDAPADVIGAIAQANASPEAALAPAPPRFAGRAPGASDLSSIPDVSAQRQQRALVEEARRRADAAARQQRLADVVGVLEGDPEATARFIDEGYEAMTRRVVRAQALGLGQRPTGGGGPARRETETFRVSRPGPATAEQAAAIDEAAREAEAGQQRAVQAQVRAMQAEADLAEQTAEEIRAVEDRLRAEEERQRAAERARQAELERRQRALDEAAGAIAAERIDPSRVFAKGNTRARVGAAIGFALASLGDAIGGTNSNVEGVMRILDSAIDKDIEAQRATLDNRARGVSQRGTLLAQMRATFGDARAAEQATKAAMLASVERQLQGLQQRALSEKQRAAIDQLLGSVQAEQAAARQQALVSGLGTIDTEVVTTRRSGGGGGGRRPRIDASALLRAAGDGEDISPTERREAADRENEARELLSRIDQAMERVRQAPEVFGPSVPNRALRFLNDPDNFAVEIGRFLGVAPHEDPQRMEARRRALAAVGRLRAIGTKALAGPGAVTDAERELFGPLTELSETSPPTVILDRLREMKQNALRQLEEAQLAVSDRAVRERQQRRPRVSREVIDDAGDQTDVAPSFEADR